VVQLHQLETDYTLILSPASSAAFSGTNFISSALAHFPPGYAFATVFANGMQSLASIIQVPAPITVPALMVPGVSPSAGTALFTWTNAPGSLFTVQTTANWTNLLTTWSILGGATETSPGHFQFTDTVVTNSERFYRLRSP
jgi:hypothetical protein